jgi:hypothetical protein
MLTKFESIALTTIITPLTLSPLCAILLLLGFYYFYPRNPVCVMRLDPTVLAFSLSLHRHPFIYILFSSHFSPSNNKLFGKLTAFWQPSYTASHRNEARKNRPERSKGYQGVHNGNRLPWLTSLHKTAKQKDVFCGEEWKSSSKMSSEHKTVDYTNKLMGNSRHDLPVPTLLTHTCTQVHQLSQPWHANGCFGGETYAVMCIWTKR